MSYWQYETEFLNTLVNVSNPVNDLKTENMAESFIAFVESKGETSVRDDLTKEYEESGPERRESFEEFICKDCLGLTGNVVVEYLILSEQAKECRSLLKARMTYFDSQIQNASNNNEKYRYKSYKNDLIDLKKDIDSRTDTNALINMALENSRLTFGCVYIYRNNFIFEMRKVRNVGSDPKRLMYFGELKISSADEMLKLRYQDKAEYLRRFKEMIREHEITNKLLDIVRRNPSISKREGLITSAIKLFESEDYQAFVYLITSQIEGLFNEYRRMLGDNAQTHGMREFIDKIHHIKIRNIEDFTGYDYFQFDFPDFRNSIEHGEIIEITEEEAFETLMDVYFVAKMIESYTPTKQN